MARIDRTISELEARLKDQESRLPPDDFRLLMQLLKQLDDEADDLCTDLSDKDDEIARLENKIEWAERESAPRAARFLCEWSRGEDPRVVRKVTEAIGGGAYCRPLPDLLVRAGHG